MLIVVNFCFFVYELSLGEEVAVFVQGHGIIPVLIGLEPLSQTLIRLNAAMFLHGGWLHLLGNMLYLWIFGDNVEDRMGRGKFILFYFFCGYAASFLHILMAPDAEIPLIGASGAVAGVLGAYLLLFPWARVLTILPIFFFLQIIRVPALVFLGLWFFLQVLNSLYAITLPAQEAQAVAWEAHIAGFICGMLLVRFLTR